MKIIKHIPEGGSLPLGYGVAFMESTRRMFVALPIPLNLIYRWLRALWWKITLPSPTKHEEHDAEIVALVRRKERQYWLGQIARGGRGMLDKIRCTSDNNNEAISEMAEKVVWQTVQTINEDAYDKMARLEFRFDLIDDGKD